MRTVERSKDRSELVREAGLGSISFVSALAGVLCAYGAVLLLLAVAGGIGNALGFETSGISENEWRDIGIGAVVAVGLVLFLSYFFGGYVAGRMGRRAGLAHGALVFLFGLLVVAVAAAATSVGTDSETIGAELRNQGIPTGADDWRDIGIFGGIGVLAAMLVGSLLGGLKGERWHGVLVTRALDPEVRPRGAEDPDDHATRDDGKRSEGMSRDRALDNIGPASSPDRSDHHDEHETVDLTEEERTAAARHSVEEERDRNQRVTRRS